MIDKFVLVVVVSFGSKSFISTAPNSDRFVRRGVSRFSFQIEPRPLLMDKSQSDHMRWGSRKAQGVSRRRLWYAAGNASFLGRKGLSTETLETPLDLFINMVLHI